MTVSSGNLWLDISRKNDMHFVYAFFFVHGDMVHVKVGESTTPYARLKSVVHGSPFPVQQAVFCVAGSKVVARKFEAFVRLSLNDQRSRGEWYVFRKEDGAEFRAAVAAAFAKATGRVIKWTKIDLEQLAFEGAAAAAKFHNRRLHKRD